MIGRQLEEYTILELAGQGGQASVYRGENARGESVAIKMLSSPDNAERFIREYQTLQSLSHENLIRVYRSGTVEQLPYFVMDFVSGKDLMHYVQSRCPGLWKHPEWIKTVTPLIRQLCEVLAFIHSRGMIHRDLKPANILVTADGHLTLMDFGLVFSHDFRTMTREGMFMGSIPYMSPEQILEQELDRRSDLYSLGVILYQLAVNEIPYLYSSTINLLEKIIRNEVVPFDKRGIKVPDWYAGIVDHLLRREREDRPSDSREVQGVIEDGILGSGLPDKDSIPVTSVEQFPPLPLFIGRRFEMTLGEKALNSQNDPENPILMFHGEPGIGKSRLLDEISVLAREKSWRVIRCDCRGDGQPFAPLADLCAPLIRELKIMPESRSAMFLENRGKLLGRVVRGFLTLRCVQDEPEPPVLSWQKAKERFTRLLIRITMRWAQMNPIILIWDNLDIADTETLCVITRWIQYLQDHPGLPFVMVGAYRSIVDMAASPMASLLQTVSEYPHAVHQQIAPLSREEITAFIHSSLPEVPPDPVLKKLIYEKAGGNPFFIRSILSGCQQATRDYQVLLDDTITITDAVLPRAVQEGLIGNLDDLPDIQRKTLDVFAVAGTFGSVDLAVNLSGISHWRILGAIGEMLQAGVIQESHVEYPIRYRFSNGLISDLVYQNMGSARRRILHRKIMDYFIRQMEAQPGYVPPEEIARHCVGARRAANACQWYRDAGFKALKLWSPGIALEYTEQAISIIDSKKVSVPVETRLDIYMIKAKMSEMIGEMDSAGLWMNRAREEAEHEGTPIQYANILIELSDLASCQAQTPLIVEYASKALAIMDMAADKMGMARCHNLLGIAAAMGNNESAAMDHFNTLIALTDPGETPQFQASALNNIGMVLNSMGKYEEGIARLKEGLVLRKAYNLRRDMAESQGNLANVYRTLCKYEKASVYYQDAYRSFLEIEDVLNAAVVLSFAADTEGYIARFKAAETMSLEALELAKTLQSTSWRKSHIMFNHGKILAALGRLEEARKIVKAAHESFRKYDHIRLIAESGFLLGWIGMNLGCYDELESLLTRLDRDRSDPELAAIIPFIRYYFNSKVTTKIDIDETKIKALLNQDQWSGSSNLTEIVALIVETMLNIGDWDRGEEYLDHMLPESPGTGTIVQFRHAYYRLRIATARNKAANIEKWQQEYQRLLMRICAGMDPKNIDSFKQRIEFDHLIMLRLLED